MKLIKSSDLLNITSGNRDLVNTFCNQTASPEQEHDLLNFRRIGTAKFDKCIAYYILKQASIHPPNGKKCLVTFSEKKACSSRVSGLEKDKRLVQKCLHKK